MKKIFLFVALAVSLFSCTDYLDMVPEKDIATIKSTFEKKHTAITILNSAYIPIQQVFNTPNFDPGVLAGHEFLPSPKLENVPINGWGYDYWPAWRILKSEWNAGDPATKWWGRADERYVVKNTNMFEGIRYCNTFINNIDNVYDMTDYEKKIYKAEAVALKATYYYMLVKMYGPIPLIPKNKDVKLSLAELSTERSTVEKCFETIDSLYNVAIPQMQVYKSQNVSEYGRLHKEAAAMLRAKAKVLKASPLFTDTDWYNGMVNKDSGEKLFKNYSEAEKLELWKDAANSVDKAIEICEAGGFGMYDKSYGLGTELLDNIRKFQRSRYNDNWKNPETVWCCWAENKPEWLSFSPHVQWGEASSETNAGDIAVPLEVVEQYFTKNGLPLDMDKNWNYSNRYAFSTEKSSKYAKVLYNEEAVLNLHRNRDPRFYASVAFNRGYWFRENEYKVIRAKKPEIYGTDHTGLNSKTKINLTGYWCKKRLPEEIDCGDNNSIINFKIPTTNLSMSDLYLLQAEAWNEVGTNTAKVYNALDKIRERVGLPNIKTAWLNYSKNPSMVLNQNGLRQIVRMERRVELAFEGHFYWDVRRWKTAESELNKPMTGWNVFGEDNASYYMMKADKAVPTTLYKKNRFSAPRDYFAPIPQKEVATTNITQNLGW
jgi:hypothetical protein